MPEVLHLEPKNLSGKGGIGKGSLSRRDANHAAYRESWTRMFAPLLKETRGTASSDHSR